VQVTSEIEDQTMWSEKEQQELDEILKKYPNKLSAVLPALYLAQREKNWLDNDDIAAVAEALDISVTHVHSIIGFYTLFRKEPVGKYMVQVCTDLPCALRGAEEFYHSLCERMGLGSRGGTTALLPVIKRPVCKSIWNIMKI
jgi:NADH:ubiquinone oxidoreductase subunit E